MSVLRLTRSAWQMLQRLGQPTAALMFVAREGRCYFTMHDQMYDLVRTSTVEVLMRKGLMRRDSSGIWHEITDYGRKTLLEKVSFEGGPGRQAQSEDELEVVFPPEAMGGLAGTLRSEQTISGVSECLSLDQIVSQLAKSAVAE